MIAFPFLDRKANASATRPTKPTIRSASDVMRRADHCGLSFVVPVLCRGDSVENASIAQTNISVRQSDGYQLNLPGAGGPFTIMMPITNSESVRVTTWSSVFQSG